jgi:hypothetical protein
MSIQFNRRSNKVASDAEETMQAQEEGPMMLDVPGMRMVSLYGDLDEKKGQ